MDHRINQHHFPLKSTIAIIIPPQHERIIELQSPISSSPQVIFRPNRVLQSHNLVAIPNALISIDKYRTYTTVVNPTNRVCRIPINTMIGTFTIPPPKGGINEIKYPTRNSHPSFVDFIHFDTNKMIKRGNPRITKRTEAVNKCLYC
ncbi:unnamed protein product [Rotaria sp. Silwood2]|nr:unnamed protein product [Rotaria sp. Silwood2]